MVWEGKTKPNSCKKEREMLEGPLSKKSAKRSLLKGEKKSPVLLVQK